MVIFWDGSAKKLNGRCLIIALFISRKKKPWKKKGKKNALLSLKQGIDWIKNESEKYKVKLKIDFICLNMEEDISVKKIPKIEAPYEDMEVIMFKVLKKLGYESPEDFYEKMNRKYRDTSFHIIFFANEKGRPYMHYVDMNNEKKMLEFNMIFKENGKIDPFTVVHETLHAYSAVDLYNVNETKKGQKISDRVEKRFPTEVMLCASEDIENPELSELTAFLVGWHSDPKDWYASMIQPDDKEEVEFLLKHHESFDEKGFVIIKKEKELLRYESDDFIISRIEINSNPDLIHWKQISKHSGDTVEYWENSQDSYYYNMTDKKSLLTIAVPKRKKGYCYKEDPDGDYSKTVKVWKTDVSAG
ncbi:MAG TPA: hypothetical protein PK453_03560 [Leptospiraceae bacterium]|nr:hypothetical protein [Leptospiraceae bacterium]HMY65036.1 hypothetical protein [Leptospiraceae bacterium]HNF12720.1 hypothetical protein [Leptospiraceae bacterium]HNF22859.1 hypothetical protein [Leptospiraceae bacterium]HNH06859.1 hypothetical protein [Leptospiraceae bacterium]